MLAVDLIGTEIQNPFAARNLGHLPLNDICRTIEENLLGLLAEEEVEKERADAGDGPRQGEIWSDGAAEPIAKGRV